MVSPWSKGGWVCSEVFDHTSLIRFIERRFARRHPGLIESNITAWRRAICGDLTSAFDFATPNAARVTLPDTAAYEPPDHDRHPDYVPVPPTQQTMPSQEPGLRHARALPYELQINGTANPGHGTFRIDFANSGEAGACFQVRSGNTADGPWTYTVEAGKSLSSSWTLAQTNQGRYDLSVYGPNGFLRTFRGSLSPTTKANLDVDASYDTDGDNVVLRITNRGPAACRVTVASAYDDDSVAGVLRPGQSLRERWSLKSSFGWYDLSVLANPIQATSASWPATWRTAGTARAIPRWERPGRKRAACRRRCAPDHGRNRAPALGIGARFRQLPPALNCSVFPSRLTSRGPTE